MSPEVIRLILWVPFGVVVAISVPVFCAAGYRRGFWNALVSLAATLVAMVFSVFMAKLLAEPVSGPIERAVIELAGDSGSAAFMPMLLRGLVSVLMALVIYFVLMLVFTVLFKYIANQLWGEKLERSGGGMRWGGMAVRLVDAAVYALLLLLPLYGSLGSFAPVVSTINSLSGADNTFQQVIESVVNHPVAKISGSGPLKTVYSRLAVVPGQSGDISIVEFTEGVSGTMERYHALTQSLRNGYIDVDQAKDLVDFLRKDVVAQEWCYNAYQELLGQTLQQLDEDESTVQELRKLMDMDQQAFTENADAILEVLQYMLDENIPVRIQQEPNRAYEILYESGLMERIGAMINVSEESVAFRNFLVRYAVLRICEQDEAKADSLMSGYRSQRNTDSEAMIADAEAMLLMMGLCPGDGTLNMYEGLLRLPGFDQEALYRQFEKEDLSYHQWVYEGAYQQMIEQLQDKYGKDKSHTELLWQALLEDSRLPIDEQSRFDRIIKD